jgi:hypothetical protein
MGSTEESQKLADDSNAQAADDLLAQPQSHDEKRQKFLQAVFSNLPEQELGTARSFSSLRPQDVSTDGQPSSQKIKLAYDLADVIGENVPIVQNIVRKPVESLYDVAHSLTTSDLDQIVREAESDGEDVQGFDPKTFRIQMLRAEPSAVVHGLFDSNQVSGLVLT